MCTDCEMESLTLRENKSQVFENICLQKIFEPNRWNKQEMQNISSSWTVQD